MTDASDQPDGRHAYFDKLYAGDADPWQYHSCSYEIAKRADTLAALPRAHYARGCEIGCSIGVLTCELAPQCDVLLGIDLAEAAAAQARATTVDLRHVSIEVRHVPYDLPEGTFDLLMLSEVLYFFTPDELLQLAAFAIDRVRPGGDLMIVSYDGETLTAHNGAASTAAFLAATANAFTVIDATARPEYHRRTLRRRDD